MSFNTALSGIRAANIDLKVTGNNIANAGTTGFKSSRAEFGDVYTSTLLGSTKTAAGSGVNLLATRQQFSQGNLKYTSNSLDLAINGSGFFVVNDQGQQLYTRAGSFGLDKEGNVVSATGANLMGYEANEDGNISGVLSPLKINVNTQTPRATTAVAASYNLDSTETVLESTGTSFSTNGASVGVPVLGIKEATHTELASATPVPGSLSFDGDPVTFTVTLEGSQPDANPRSTTVQLNTGTNLTPDRVAEYINSAIYSSADPINVQAVVRGGNLVFQDLAKGASSTITVSGVSGGNPLAGVLNSLGTSTPGQPQANNGYGAQTLSIRSPNGEEFTHTSVSGASAAETAAKLNSIAGFTATASNKATITLNPANPNERINADRNLVLNGVVLRGETASELVAEINSLTTSTLPGITAAISTDQQYLELNSSIGVDFNFSFIDNGAVTGAGRIEVKARPEATPQQIASNDFDQAVVVGGTLNVMMAEGYEITGSEPQIGNIMEPLGPLTFTSVPINAFDPKNQDTYNHASSARIFDSLGNEHVLTKFFVKQPYSIEDPSTSPNHWKMYVQIDGQNVGDPDPTLPPPANMEATMASFNVHFNMDGTLNKQLTDTMLISNWTPLDKNGDPIGALAPLNVLQGGTLPVPEPATSSNFEITLDDTTQFSSKFAVEDLSQNGYTTGRLAGLDVGSDGIVFARFTNGEAQVLGQLALANFNNVDGLKPVGSTMWAQTYETGEAIIGLPNTSSLGDISSGAIEESNVDLSEQLVNLIIAQRNYQANAKTIETANATTQTIINLR